MSHPSIQREERRGAPFLASSGETQTAATTRNQRGGGGSLAVCRNGHRVSLFTKESLIL